MQFPPWVIFVHNSIGLFRSRTVFVHNSVCNFRLEQFSSTTQSDDFCLDNFRPHSIWNSCLGQISPLGKFLSHRRQLPPNQVGFNHSTKIHSDEGSKTSLQSWDNFKKTLNFNRLQISSFKSCIIKLAQQKRYVHNQLCIID